MQNKKNRVSDALIMNLRTAENETNKALPTNNKFKQWSFNVITLLLYNHQLL